MQTARKKTYKHIFTVGGCLCVAVLFFGMLEGWKIPTSLFDRQTSVANRDGSAVRNYFTAYYAAKHYQFDDAPYYFQQAMEEYPTHPDILRHNYVSTTISKGMKKSLYMMRSHLGDYSPEGKIEDITGSIPLALEAFKKGQFQKAITLIETEHPVYFSMADQSLSSILRGWLYVAAGQHQKAWDIFDSITDNEELANLAYYTSGLAHDILGNHEKATEIFDKITAHYPEKNRHLVHILGNFYTRTAQYEKAKALYESYNKQHPFSIGFMHEMQQLERKASVTPLISSVTDGMTELLMEFTSTLYKEKMYIAAHQYLQMIRYLNPEHTRASYMLGKIWEDKGFYEKSLAAFEEVSTPTALYIQAQIKVAELWHLQGKTEKAHTLLSKLTTHYPEDSESQIVLANFLQDIELYHKAALVYSDMIKKQGSIASVHDWFLYYMRGVCYERTNQWEKAEEDLIEALRLQPNHPEILNYLGYSWVIRDKNITQATLMIETALKQRPDEPHIIDSMGWALFSIGEYETALAFLEKALALSPADTTINEHLGDVYWHLNRQNEARFQWQHGLQYSKEPDVKKRLQDKLENGISPLSSSQ